MNIYCNMGNYTNEMTIKIVDITGKTIRQSNHQVNQNEITVSENISGLSAGTYFVQLVMNQKQIAVEKIIKL